LVKLGQLDLLVLPDPLVQDKLVQLDFLAQLDQLVVVQQVQLVQLVQLDWVQPVQLDHKVQSLVPRVILDQLVLQVQ
jgi:hypothetical protein